MSSLNFPDANLWVALCVSRHVHAQRAQAWFDQAESGTFFLCRFTQITVLRILTTEAALGTDTQTMKGAWKLLDRILDDKRISFLAEPFGLDREFRALTQLTTRSPKVWADAYLLAFAAAAGVKLITFDRALRNRGADVLVL